MLRTSKKLLPRCRVLAAAVGLSLVGSLFAATTSEADTSPSPTPGTAPSVSARAAAPLAAAAAPSAPGGLGLVVSEYGHVSKSIAGVASDGTAGANATVNKPAGATVRGAYLAYATTGFTNQVLSSPLTLDGAAVPLDHVTATGIRSYNYFADVTSLVKPKLDQAPAGPVSFLVAEPQPDLTDGEILTVIYDDPNVTTNQTVSLLYGALSPTGDSYQVQLSSPIKVSDPNTHLEMSLGISYSYQENGVQQYSTVKVNGNLLTSSAGGSDDGLPHNGGLITVGGEGDSLDNPSNPSAPPTGTRSDDELYNLLPYVHDGDTSITVATQNPSLDDNVFFAAFTMNPPASTIATGGSAYVALGDSYQSGEGAYDYVDGTDAPGDKCHRSQNAYPYLIQGKANVPQTLVDVACSGALIHNLTDGQNGEAPQYDALTDRTALVTIGIGGNDMGFADTVKACALGPQLSGDFFQVTQTCHGRFDAQVESTLKDLNTPDPSDGLTKFERVYNTIRQKAPHARIVVIGYPHFFKPSGNFFGCNLIYRSDEKWMDAKIEEVDAVIEQNALAMGAEYTGGYSEFDGHELCGDGEEWLNGIVGVPPHSESFHPNKAGHVQISRILLDELQNHQPTATFTIQQNQTINYDFVVSSLQAVLSFLTSWPGSTVTTQLTDPNGRVITPTTTASDVFHSAGPTTELYKINNPAPGTWHVTLHGQDVAATGEPVALTASQAPALNKLPVAVGTATANDAGTTVTYSAAGSYDPDGKIASYEWDFGDGTSATGSVVTHTYTNIGHLDQPTLLVTDNRGGLGFADMPNVKVHYGFQPLETFAPSPTVPSSKAGGSIRLSFRLTSPTGEPVSALSALTSYSFDESGGTYSVAYMPASRMYTITVTSPVTWRKTTRTFTLKLDDQSIHTVAVRFS